MKYGIYEAKEENCTTYWTFNLKDNEDAEKWLNTDEADFRLRTLCSKSYVRRYAKGYAKLQEEEI